MSRSTETMTFKNPTEHTLNLSAVGLDDVEPGAEVEIPLELCAPGRGDSGARSPSAIECVAPQLTPVDPSDLKLWKKAPPAPKPISKIVTIAARPRDEAPGVKALREQREASVKATAVAQTAAKSATQKAVE